MVHLDTNESVTVSNPAANTVTFTLSGTGTDIWTPTNVSADGGGDGTTTIAFNAAGDLSASISIDNSGAGAGTNDVTFSLGTITSGSLSVDTTMAAGATGDIVNSAALQATGGGTISLTSSGAISETGGGTLSTAGILSTSSATGTSLTGANTVGTFIATNTTSGDVDLTNTATTLTITGISETGGNINVTNTGTVDAVGTITDTAGTVNLTASSTLSVNALSGTTVNLTSNTDAVDSTGSMAVAASGTLTVDAATGITLNTDAVDLVATNSTSGDISITQLATPVQTVTITGSGVVNDAATGTIKVTNLGASIDIGTGVNVDTTGNGDIDLAALDFQISGDIHSGTGRTILESSVAGSSIDLGNNTSGTVGLTNAELQNITAGVLQIGNATAGTINVSAAITAPAGWDTLTLINNGTITEAAGGSLTVSNLSVSSTGPVTLTSANDVGSLAASTTNAFSFSDGSHLLTVDTVDADTGIVSTNSNITLIADSMSIEQAVNAGTAIVTLEPSTSGLAINLGTNPSAGKLGLAQGDLDNVTASVLRIGSVSAGDITNSAAITDVGTGWTTLSLITGGAIIEGALGSLTTTDLALRAGNGIGSTATPLSVETTTLAAANTVAGSIDVSESTGALTIGTVDGIIGVSNTATTGLVGSDLQAADGNLTLNDAVSTGADALSLTADGAGMLFNSNATVSATAPITVTADLMSLSGGIIAAGAARVILQPETAGQTIDLGTNPSAGNLGLAQSDLATVTTTGTLQIGNSSAGAINVSATIAPATVGTLDLQTNSGITQSVGATITVGNLAIRAASTVTLNNANDITTGSLAAAVSGSGDTFSFTAANNTLTLGTADGLTGLTTNDGAVTITADAGLTVSQAVNAGTAAAALTGTGRVNVNADITGSTATVNGGSGGDNTIVVTTTGTTSLSVNGGGGNNTVFVQALSGLLGSVLGSTVNINAGTGTNTLGITEEAATTGDTLTVTPSEVLGQGSSPFTIDYAATGGTFGLIGLATGSGNNSVNVTGTDGLTLLNTGTGSNNIAVTASSGLLGSTLNGTLSINAGGGTNTLSVTEANATTADSVVVTGNAITGDGTSPFQVSYAATGGSFSNIGVTLGSGANSVGVEGTAGPTLITTGAGNDTLCVSTATGGLLGTALNGTLMVNLGGGSNTFACFETNATSAEKLDVSSNQLVGQGASPFTIDYTATGGTLGGGFGLVTGSGDNTILVSSQRLDGPLTISGTGQDQMQVLVTSSSDYSPGTPGSLNFVVFGGAGSTLQVTDNTGGGNVQTTNFNSTNGEVTVSYTTADASLSTIFFQDFTVE